MPPTAIVASTSSTSRRRTAGSSSRSRCLPPPTGWPSPPTSAASTPAPPTDRCRGSTSNPRPDADGLLKSHPAPAAIKGKTNFGAFQPVGLPINPRSSQALIACANWTLGLDLHTETAQTFNQASHGDLVRYDSAADRFLVASPGTSTVAIFGGSPLAYISSVVTGAGAKAAGYDETNRLVYTTDLRPNRVGLAGFQIPDGAPTLSSLMTLAPLAALLPLIVLVLFIVGRQADPIRRPEPLLTREEAKRARLDHKRAHDTSQA